MDDDVGTRKRPLDGGLDTVGIGVTLTHSRARRDRDHDVRERAARCAAQAQAAQLDRRIERADRRAGGGDVVRRRPVHEHVDVAATEAEGGEDDEHRDEERGDRVRFGPAGAHRHEPAEHRQRAHEVAAEMEGVGEERGAVVSSRRAVRDRGAREVDGDHDRDGEEGPPGGVDLGLEHAAEPQAPRGRRPQR